MFLRATVEDKTVLLLYVESWTAKTYKVRFLEFATGYVPLIDQMDN